MGQVLNYCAVIDSDTKVRLEKVEAENEELKQQLLESKQRYIELEHQLEKQVHRKIDKLIEDKTRRTHELVAEKRDKARLVKKYQKTERRASQIRDKATLLAQQNDALRMELARRSVSGDTLEEYQEPQTSSESEDEHITEESSVTGDREKIRNWLHYNKLKEKQLKMELSTLLTARSEAHRAELRDTYREKYVSDIMDDITEIIKKKGHTLAIISGLLQTRAEFDAVWIKDVVSSKHPAIKVADIICCRDISELRLICNEYKKMYGKSLKEKLAKLASTKTYQHIINHIFDFSRHRKETTNLIKIAAKVTGDLSYLTDKNVKWKKDDNKKRLALMVLGNSRNYVHDLNEKYFKATNTNLTDFVRTQIGDKSTTGHWMKLRIEYCADPADFYAHSIQISNNTVEIGKLFVSNFGGNGVELKKIRKRFNELNYGDGKTMMQWIEKKCHSKHHSGILIKMLQNAGRL